MSVREVVAGVFCAIGALFFIIGTTGLLRLPDFFSRLHPSTKCDTLGGCSVLVGMMVYAGWSWEIPRLVVIAGFLLLYSATCGHAMGRSGFLQGMAIWRKAPTGTVDGEEEDRA